MAAASNPVFARRATTWRSSRSGAPPPASPSGPAEGRLRAAPERWDVTASPQAETRDAPVPGRASGNRYDAQSPLRGEARCASPPYIADGTRRVGLVSDDGLTLQPLELTPQPKRPRRVAARRDPSPTAARAPLPSDGRALKVADVALEAPLPRPRRNLWCVGRNYHAHAKELSASVFKDNDAKPDAWPIVFTKVPECVVGPHDDVRLPGDASRGRSTTRPNSPWSSARAARTSRAPTRWSHVFGYTIVNDVTARDVQMRHQQWDMGKSFDTFCPMGPWIVTADELDGTKTRVRCWVNGELRQDGATDRPDLRHPDADRDLLARHHAVPGRRHRHRHAGRRRHGHEAAALPEGGRRGARRDRRPRRDREPVRLKRQANTKEKRMHNDDGARLASPARPGRRVLAAPPLARAQAQLPRQADHDDRALPARRRRRHGGAPGRRGAVARAQAAGGGREQAPAPAARSASARPRVRRPTATRCC